METAKCEYCGSNHIITSITEESVVKLTCNGCGAKLDVNKITPNFETFTGCFSGFLVLPSHSEETPTYSGPL